MAAPDRLELTTLRLTADILFFKEKIIILPARHLLQNPLKNPFFDTFFQKKYNSPYHPDRSGNEIKRKKKAKAGRTLFPLY